MVSCFCPPRRRTIHRAALILTVIPLILVAVPDSSSAARSLALPRSDYPKSAQIVSLPATNDQADRLLGPAHRTPFAGLHRLDGLGWLQAAIWHFKTGRGGATQQHQTVFGYGINVFHNAAQARRALADVKIKRRAYRVAHLPALLYQSTDVRQTLLFVFFAYKSVEVEAYYEYVGVATNYQAKMLRHTFSRQASHLAHLARGLARTLNEQPTPPPTATPSPVPTSTPAPTATVTSTPSPTPTPVATAAPPTATSTPVPTASPSPTAGPTATAAPAGFAMQAQLTKPAVPPGGMATVQVQVTRNGQPAAGATLSANFQFPKQPESCVGITDKSGIASCSVTVPTLPDGTQIQVAVQVVGAAGENVADVLTLTIRSASHS